MAEEDDAHVATESYGSADGRSIYAGAVADDAPDTPLPTVVLGGGVWSSNTLDPSVQNARELARTRPTLFVHTEGYGTLGERFGRLIEGTSWRHRRGLFATRMRLRRDGERLWLASVGGLYSLLPLASIGPLRRFHAWRGLRAIRRWLREIEADRCAVLTSWWFAADVLERLPEAATSIYDCTDEHTAYPGSSLKAEQVRGPESRLLDLVDRAYVVSPGLLASRQAPGRDVTVLPQGFDVRRFHALERAGWAVPDWIASLDGPVVGLLGRDAGRVDWPLMEQLIVRRPACTFVFIGDSGLHGPEALLDRPNVRVVGFVPYPEALAAVSRLDAALIPFVDTPFTRGCSFLKLLDFLVHGVPVIATPLPDTERVAAEGQGLVYLPADVDAWLTAIDQALAEPADAAVRAARRQLVERHSVAHRVAEMMGEDVG
jgi:glycosyltransferase involved in cell wall biosynthesis